MSRSSEDLQAILAQIDQLERDEKIARELAEQEKKRNQEVKKQKERAQASLPAAQEQPDDLDEILARITQCELNEKFAREVAEQGNKPKASAPTASLDADLAYALNLQTQFELEKTRARARQQSIDGDAALAAALQEEERASFSGSSGPSHAQIQKRWEGKSQEERKKIEAALRTLLDEPAVRGEYGADGTPILTDAHKYTRTLIRDGIPILTGIDEQFRLSSNTLPPGTVLTEVLAFLEKSRKEIEESAKRNADFLRISTDHIRTSFVHVNQNSAMETEETQANAHHLLSRTWTLAKSLGINYMAAVATILSDNIGDQGHCIPGLIARLYAQYAVMIGTQLGVEGSPRPRPAAAAKPA